MTVQTKLAFTTSSSAAAVGSSSVNAFDQRHPAGGDAIHAAVNQLRGVNQQAGAGRLVQIVFLQSAESARRV
jgi:hypothetical protein